MSDTGDSDDSQDNGTSDSDTPASVLGGVSLTPWTPADSSLNFSVDPDTMKTIDFGGATPGSDAASGDQGQPPQPGDGGFYTGLTPYQPASSPDGAQGSRDYSIGPIDTPPFQYPDRLQTDQALSSDPRVQAFLAVLRGQEGQRYDAVVGGGSFDDYSQHPDIGVGNSHAAGAYQFQPGTWEPIQKALSLPDFSPDLQDLAAVDLLRQTGATDKLLANDPEGAIFAASRQWSGMPSQAETMTDGKGRTRGIDTNGNATFTLDQTRANYQKNLGSQ